MYKFSVIIPLYNKETEILRAVESVLTQLSPPMEIIVIDDGSSDRGAILVEELNSPIIKVIHQTNSGVSTARNNGIESSSGDYIAFLDADDWWNNNFLSEIGSLIDLNPESGLYMTAYCIHERENKHIHQVLKNKGVIDDFFKEVIHNSFTLPSVCCVPKRVFDNVGVFPNGMKLGEDHFMWTKIAEQYTVSYSPIVAANYSISSSNRSGAIFQEEICEESFDRFYDPNGDIYKNEYIAKCSIGKATTIAAKGGDVFPKHVERFYSYTKMYRRGLWKLRIINRLPKQVRWSLYNVYNYFAWHIAKKGSL